MKVIVNGQPLLVNGTPIWVTWNYEPTLSPRDQKKGQATQCTIRGQKEGDGEPPVLAIGLAFTHKLDRYDKFEGRKTALKHALESSPLSRAEREQVWHWYFATHKQGPHEVRHPARELAHV